MIGASSANPSHIMPASFESWLEKVLDSIFQKGVNSATLSVMNYTFYALFAVLTTLFLGSGLNLHVLALLILAIALCLATNWYVCARDSFQVCIRTIQGISEAKGEALFETITQARSQVRIVNTDL